MWPTFRKGVPTVLSVLLSWLELEASSLHAHPHPLTRNRMPRFTISRDRAPLALPWPRLGTIAAATREQAQTQAEALFSGQRVVVQLEGQELEGGPSVPRSAAEVMSLRKKSESLPF